MQLKTNTCQLYAMLPRTRTLGPYLRFAIWVQGCKQNCHYCMSPDARPLKGGEQIPIQIIMDTILSDSQIEGITISGGEPFLQAKALAQMVNNLQSQRNLGVIVYTGYTLAQLLDWPCQTEKTDIFSFLKVIDLLIDGPYMHELNDGKSLRGSSNQLFHFFTDRYKQDIDQSCTCRSVELHLMSDTVFFAGIPGSNMLMNWHQMTKKNSNS